MCDNYKSEKYSKKEKENIKRSSFELKKKIINTSNYSMTYKVIEISFYNFYGSNILRVWGET